MYPYCKSTLVLINYGTEPASADVPGLAPGARLKSAYPAGGAPARAGRDGSLRVPLAPQSVRVLVVRL